MNNRLILLITCVAALGGLLFGYDTGVINGTQFYFSKYFELAPAMKGWVVSSALLGCFFGAIIAGPVSNAIGRKSSLVISALLFTLSAWGSGLPSFLPQSIPLLVFFRIIGGLGIGVASMNAPMYIAEIAPADRRGNLVSYYQLAIVIGFFVVFLVTYFIGGGDTAEMSEAQLLELQQYNTRNGWRVMFWSELIPCALFLGMLFTVPRSPRWLVMKGREEEAKAVLLRIHGEAEAGHELEEIKSSLDSEKSKSVVSPFAVGVLPIIVIGSLLSIFQQFTGINAVLYYGADIFEQALGIGQDQVLQQQVLLAGVNFLFTFIAMYTVDKLGRKPLLLIGSGGMVAGFLLLGITLMSGNVGVLSLIGVLTFIGSFAMSLGPVTWVILAEMFPNKIRSMAMSIAVSAQWAANYLVSLSFPIVAESEVNKGPTWNLSLPYFIFSGFIILLIFFTVKYIPETKGRSLEELEGVWSEKYGEIKS